MKPTDKQQRVCDAIIDQLKYWRDTNDLYCPVHDVDIEDCVWASLQGVVTSVEMHEVERGLYKILQFLRKLENDN